MSSDGDVKRPASNLLVCVATAREADGLPHVIAGRTIDIVETGVGPVNAAIALTRVLAAATPATIVSLGIGGAYPGAGLTPGDVVCATSERYGDLGAESPEGFLDMAALGFPIVPGDPIAESCLAIGLQPLSLAVPFVTVCTATGTDLRAKDIATRTGGAVESMEGAAIVQVARMFGVPVAEVRGISNAVGRRDRSGWKIAEAIAAARHALVSAIEDRRL